MMTNFLPGNFAPQSLKRNELYLISMGLMACVAFATVHNFGFFSCFRFSCACLYQIIKIPEFPMFKHYFI